MEEIRQDMFKAFDVLLDKFASIGIRYEHSEEYDCFLVSVDVSRLDASELDCFSMLFLEQIRLLQEKFGDDAPLFCMNDEWFSLSPGALHYIPNKKETKTTRDFKWSDANVYGSIIRMRQLLYPSRTYPYPR